jgi:hypothetical protein
MNARDPARTAMCTAVDIECDFPAPWPPRNNQHQSRGHGQLHARLQAFSRPTAVLQQ